MTGEESGGAGENRLSIALVALTALTGVLDAVAFLGLGRIFTAFMTGTILFLGFAAAGAEGVNPAASLTALVAFVAGVIAGGRLAVIVPAGRRAVPGHAEPAIPER